MAYDSRMDDAITRSTFAYATFLFVVLFAPQVGFEHHHTPGINSISLFPDGVTFVLMCVVLGLAVRQAAHGQRGDVYARGFARGCSVSAIGAALYAIGMAFVAPVVFSSQLFAWTTVVLDIVVVTVIGSALSALFARHFARATGAARRPA